MNFVWEKLNGPAGQVPFASSSGVLAFGWSARHGRRLGGGVTWSVQLNVANAFQGNKVVAASVQPDGSMARGMIREGSAWSITNTFNF